VISENFAARRTKGYRLLRSLRSMSEMAWLQPIWGCSPPDLVHNAAEGMKERAQCYRQSCFFMSAVALSG